MLHPGIAPRPEFGNAGPRARAGVLCVPKRVPKMEFVPLIEVVTSSPEALEGEVVEAGEWTPQEAADYVSEPWQKAVGSIVETGRRVTEAKQRVGHGRWLEAVTLMPFGKSTAAALIQIASHPDLSNFQHVGSLPASWGTLAVLAQLPAGEIPRRIEAGEITPELDRARAQEMASKYLAARQEALNAYSEAIDGLTRALSWAKTYPPPDDIPDGYVSIEEFAERITALAEIVEGWAKR